MASLKFGASDAKTGDSPIGEYDLPKCLHSAAQQKPGCKNTRSHAKYMAHSPSVQSDPYCRGGKGLNKFNQYTRFM